MRKIYNADLAKASLTVLSVIFLCGSAYASVLNIKNDDTAEVDIVIEAGDGNILSPAKEAIKLTLKEGEERMVEVNKNQLNKETFSVTGTVKMPSLHNKCGPLLIDKNYKITFTGAKTGATICISHLEELK